MISTTALERSAQASTEATDHTALSAANETPSSELFAERSDLELLHLAFNLGTPLAGEVDQEVLTLPAETEQQPTALASDEAPAMAFDLQPPRYLMGDLPPVAATPNNATASTRLPAGWTFTGRIVSNADVDVGCRIDGSITLENPKSRVLLRAESTTVGDVVARDVTIEGTHTGRIDASNGNVSLAKTSKVNGEVRYTTIQMQGGVHRMQLQYVEPTSA